MDHIVNTLTAGKHLVENKAVKFYVGMDYRNEPARMFLSREEAQECSKYETFAVFSQEGEFEGWLHRICGEIV